MADTRLRVLFVDDSADDVRWLTAELQKGGFNVSSARVDHEEAFRKALADGLFDIILCDWVVPGFGAAAALAIVRELRVGLPTIIVSGMVGEEAVVDALRAGADDFVTKQQLARLVPAVERGLREAATRCDKQKSEAALERAREDFRRAVELAPDPVFIRSAERLVYVNPAFVECAGADSADVLLGKSILSLTSAKVYQTIIPSEGGPRENRAQICWTRPDGGERDLELSSESAIVFEGISAYLTIARDNTKQRQLEAQLIASERLASIGTLAAGIAHEINNPLFAVSANTEMALETLRAADETGLSARTVKELEAALLEVREASERVGFISRDLRSLARPEDKMSTTAVDACAVMTSSLRLARHATKRAVRIVSDFDAVLPVEASEPRLSQVFLNLLVNAGQALEASASAENEIRVSIKMSGSDRVLVEIRDNGPGISAENIERIFTPFFSTKERGKGTGLGLSISRRIVTSMGGELSFESALGGGACFRVSLPVARGELETGRADALLPVPKRARVLVIDDDPLVGSTIQRVFAREHEVETFGSGNAALERVRRGERFDLILSAMEGSGLNTADLYAQLLALAPDQAARVTFVTRGIPDSFEREFLDQVANPHLEKPFDVRALRALLSRTARNVVSP
jgi:PAS domain S-box-containing protein